MLAPSGRAVRASAFSAIASASTRHTILGRLLATMAAPTATSQPAESAPWHASLPAPRSTPDSISVQDLHTELQRQREKGADLRYLIVDVRRADIEGDAAIMIPGAINLPAQTFHQTLPTLVPLLSRTQNVVFHCSSSNGRGPRCAGWYQDALDDLARSGGNKQVRDSKAWVLKGGIKAWVKEYSGEVVKI